MVFDLNNFTLYLTSLVSQLLIFESVVMLFVRGEYVHSEKSNCLYRAVIQRETFSLFNFRWIRFAPKLLTCP